MTRGAGPMILPFPWTSPAPWPFSAALKFYKFSVEIAIPLRVILIPVFHYGCRWGRWVLGRWVELWMGGREIDGGGNFGKSTHISTISNSVTHLRSYTNSAIAGNSVRSQTSPHRASVSSHTRIEWRVFHNVLRVSWCFTSGSRCITMFYESFMMFYYV